MIIVQENCLKNKGVCRKIAADPLRLELSTYMGSLRVTLRQDCQENL